jgi:hypothetical protein
VNAGIFGRYKIINRLVFIQKITRPLFGGENTLDNVEEECKTKEAFVNTPALTALSLSRIVRFFLWYMRASFFNIWRVCCFAVELDF